MTYVLGLSFNYHDAAAALLRDGDIVAASTEERHTRVKHDAAFPARAIEVCLRQAGIAAADLDAVAYHEDAIAKFNRIFTTSIRTWRRGGRQLLRHAVDIWARQAKFEPAEQIAHVLRIPVARVMACTHHASHAASAFFCSPFDRATIVTLDGVGESETCTVSRGDGRHLRKLYAVHYPHSIGLFYSAMTAYLGFEVNEGEYKVMGMAAYGEPVFEAQMLRWFDLRRDGTFALSDRLFDFSGSSPVPYRPALTHLLGPPRSPEAPFAPDHRSGDVSARETHYANVAASAQKVTERVVQHVVAAALSRTGVPNLCLAGGVALNSAANGRLRESLGTPMFVQPAAGDAGASLGAAQWAYHSVLGGDRVPPMRSAALGSTFSEDQLLRALRATYSPERWQRHADDSELCGATARLLSQDRVVGWFQGRSEWGPRALGQRSILASPRSAAMQAVVNEKVKFREPFRPFAPAVTVEDAGRYFELGPEATEEESGPLNFMLQIVRVKDSATALIPAVTHVDGTARVQLVRRDVNPLFHRLLTTVGQLTGVPVLLNTSFNLRGEPVVDAPQDAIQTFEWSGLDALALGPFTVTKL